MITYVYIKGENPQIKVEKKVDIVISSDSELSSHR